MFFQWMTLVCLSIWKRYKEIIERSLVFYRPLTAHIFSSLKLANLNTKQKSQADNCSKSYLYKVSRLEQVQFCYELKPKLTKKNKLPVLTKKKDAVHGSYNRDLRSDNSPVTGLIVKHSKSSGSRVSW